MRTTLEHIRECARHIAVFDVRMELFRDSEVLRILRLVITSCDSDVGDSGRTKEVHDYGKFVFLKLRWSGEQVDHLMEQMQIGTPIDIEDLGATNLNALTTEFQFDRSRVFSGEDHRFGKRQYPFDLYESMKEVEKSQEYSIHDQLNSRGLPYFPRLEEAEAFYLFDVFLEHSNRSRKQIEIAIDDRRARFERIVVTRRGLHVSLTGTELSGCELKLFGKRPGLVIVVPVIAEGEVEIPLDNVPAELNVYVSCGGEIIDQRCISDRLLRYAPTEGVTVERDEQTSIEGILLLNGENQHVEFKQQYSDKVLATICAFANAEGGSIFVGMTDEGEIQGINEKWDEIRQRIENALADRTLGHVQINYFPHTMSVYGNRIVLEVRVSEAEGKPIAIRNKDKEIYYLRRDGTNRIMKRDDWVNLIGTQQRLV